MTSPPCPDYRRVAVIAPGRRVDLAVPGDLTVADLLPGVLDLARIDVADSRSRWALGRIGGPRFAGDWTLDEIGVRDGEVLLLRPDRLPDPPPVIDEITDVAAAVAAESGTVTAGHTARVALTVSGLVLAAALPAVWGQRGVAGPAVLVAAAVLFVNAIVGGRRHHPSPAPLFGLAALGYAAVAACGLLTLPSRAEPLVIAALLLVGSPAAAVVLGIGRRSFTSVTTAAAVGVPAGAAHLLGADATQIAVGVLVAATSLLPWAPRVAAWVGRLPHPGSTPVDDRTELPRLDLDDLRMAARRALDHLTGIDLGLAVATAVSAVALVGHGGGWSSALAALGVATLLIRAGGLQISAQVMALAVPAALALVTGVAVAGCRIPADDAAWIPTGAVLLAVVVGAFGVVAPRRAWSPSVRRAARGLRSAVELCVVPVAVAALQGYQLVRHR